MRDAGSRPLASTYAPVCLGPRPGVRARLTGAWPSLLVKTVFAVLPLASDVRETEGLGDESWGVVRRAEKGPAARRAMGCPRRKGRGACGSRCSSTVREIPFSCSSF